MRDFGGEFGRLFCHLVGHSLRAFAGARLGGAICDADTSGKIAPCTTMRIRIFPVLQQRHAHGALALTHVPARSIHLPDERYRPVGLLLGAAVLIAFWCRHPSVVFVGLHSSLFKQQISVLA